VVKSRMQGLEAHKYKSTLDCCGQILKDEGLMGFYKVSQNLISSLGHLMATRDAGSVATLRLTRFKGVCCHVSRVLAPA
jgi:hypothetical protein